MGQISAYDPLPSGMADIGFQHMLPFLAVICCKHEKLKDLLLHIIGIHLKTAGTFPDGEDFIHWSEAVLHQIIENNLIIKTVSVYIRSQRQKLFILKQITADDHPACQLKKASHIHALAAELLHNGKCL